MKNIFKLLALFVLLTSMQCDDDKPQGITQEMLNSKKQDVLNYISEFSCTDASTCSYIAFGAKPCGGPREYLSFPTSIDLQTLQTLVDEYYEMDNAYNIQTGAVSDCALVGPPNTLDCVNGDCIIID